MYFYFYFPPKRCVVLLYCVMLCCVLLQLLVQDKFPERTIKLLSHSHSFYRMNHTRMLVCSLSLPKKKNYWHLVETLTTLVLSAKYVISEMEKIIKFFKSLLIMCTDELHTLRPTMYIKKVNRVNFDSML